MNEQKTCPSHFYYHCSCLCGFIFKAVDALRGKLFINIQSITLNQKLIKGVTAEVKAVLKTCLACYNGQLPVNSVVVH